MFSEDHLSFFVHADGSRRGRVFFTSVWLSLTVFRTTYQKPMQLESSNLT